jgi:hypothetical protein
LPDGQVVGSAGPSRPPGPLVLGGANRCLWCRPLVVLRVVWPPGVWSEGQPGRTRQCFEGRGSTIFAELRKQHLRVYVSTVLWCGLGSWRACSWEGLALQQGDWSMGEA